MAKANLQFDFNQASTLRTQLKNMVGEIDSTLGEIKKDVDGCTVWWSGGSEKEFIQNFDKTKKKIKEGLENWLDEYSKLMQKVEKAKENADKAIGNALKN